MADLKRQPFRTMPLSDDLWAMGRTIRDNANVAGSGLLQVSIMVKRPEPRGPRRGADFRQGQLRPAELARRCSAVMRRSAAGTQARQSLAAG